MIRPFGILCLSLILFQTGSAQFAANSVLNEGSFFKIAVDASGMYRIDHNWLNQLTGADGIDPNKITIYGNRGGMLPEAVNVQRIDDLTSIPFQFEGDGDSNWEGGEYLYFYAEGPDQINYGDGSISHVTNAYEVSNYYFLCTDCSDGKQVTELDVAGDVQRSVSSYDRYQFHDMEWTNLLGRNFGTQGTGRIWFGESFFGLSEQEFVSFFDFNDVIDGSTVQITATAAARSNANTTLRLSSGGHMSTRTLHKVDLFDPYGRIADYDKTKLEFQHQMTSPIKNLEVAMFNSSSVFEGWLDYLSVQTEARLEMNEEALMFGVLGTTEEVIAYNIASVPANMQIWQVGAPDEVRRMNVLTSGSNATFKGLANTNYIAFSDPLRLPTPTFFKEVENQNLHAVVDAEYVILYHDDFEDEAQRLADHRRTHDDLIVYAFDVDKVFNEFGGGSKDPVAIREFARMLYERNATFSYLCLFGDATYDYRNILEELPDDNFIPTYQTKESFNPLSGFPSDDFYGLLNANEGDDLKGGVDIAIGRIPVGTAQEASIVVDKIISYDTDPGTNGSWKNNFILLADDEDSNTHLVQSERLGRELNNDYPVFHQQKVYFDAFEQVSTAGDPRFPDAKAQMNEYMEQGALILNYFGHGGPNGWAQERVLENQDVISWTNRKRHPLFITATCTFTGFDDAALKSGGELTLLNPNGGSIALVSTTRAVTIDANERLVKSFFEYVYDEDDNGDALRLGEVMRRAKNNHSSDTLGTNARKFSLFGDPAIQLAFPQYDIRIHSLTSLFTNESIDTIGALDQVQLRGDIIDDEGNLVEDFSGSVELTVLDKIQTIRTRGTDSRSFETDFEMYNSVLFKGQANVINGEFSIDFILPKDIDYGLGQGRFSLYASESNSMRDANGFYEDFLIGGTSQYAENDHTPPMVSLFMNNRFFEDGGSVNPNPIMIADLKDDVGFNLSRSAIGHEMVAILDGEVRNPIVLNNFYRSVEGQTSQGVIEYPFKNLEEGEHTLTVRVWDVSNNAAETTIRFVVEKGQIQIIENVIAYPNPAEAGNSEINISFTHQLSATPIDIQIWFYDMFGRRVSQADYSFSTGGQVVDGLRWSGEGFNHVDLPSGTYTYIINATATDANGKQENASSTGNQLILLK